MPILCRQHGGEAQGSRARGGDRGNGALLQGHGTPFAQYSICVRRAGRWGARAPDALPRSPQKYHVSVRGVSYGRCKKYWDDFEELYDALEMRYSDQLQGLPFPTYCTRRNHSKKEAVEINRKNLETMLVRYLNARLCDVRRAHTLLHASKHPCMHACAHVQRGIAIGRPLLLCHAPSSPPAPSVRRDRRQMTSCVVDMQTKLLQHPQLSRSDLV